MNKNLINDSYNNLINIWSNLSTNPPYIAKEDLLAMNLKNNNKVKIDFNFDFLPQPYWGNIKNPKIIILTLNPGFYSEEDYKTNTVYKTNLLNNLKQQPSLNWFDLLETKDKTWWFNTIKDLLDDNIALDDIYHKVGFFELLGYHSKSFKAKSYSNLNDLNKVEFGIENGILPSQKAMFDYLESLLSQDEGKRPLVAIIWGQKFWLQALPSLKSIDYIDTISTTTHLLSLGNLRPIDFARLKKKLTE